VDEGMSGPEAMHLQHRVTQQGAECVVDVRPDHVSVRTYWEDGTSVYCGPIRTSQSIARCERAIRALEGMKARLEHRRRSLCLGD